MKYFIELVLIRVATGSVLRINVIMPQPAVIVVKGFNGFECVEQNTLIAGPAA